MDYTAYNSEITLQDKVYQIAKFVLHSSPEIEDKLSVATLTLLYESLHESIAILQAILIKTNNLNEYDPHLCVISIKTIHILITQNPTDGFSRVFPLLSSPKAPLLFGNELLEAMKIALPNEVNKDTKNRITSIFQLFEMHFDYICGHQFCNNIILGIMRSLIHLNAMDELKDVFKRFLELNLPTSEGRRKWNLAIDNINMDIVEELSEVADVAASNFQEMFKFAAVKLDVLQSEGVPKPILTSKNRNLGECLSALITGFLTWITSESRESDYSATLTFILLIVAVDARSIHPKDVHKKLCMLATQFFEDINCANLRLALALSLYNRAVSNGYYFGVTLSFEIVLLLTTTIQEEKRLAELPAATRFSGTKNILEILCKNKNQINLCRALNVVYVEQFFDISTPQHILEYYRIIFEALKSFPLQPCSVALEPKKEDPVNDRIYLRLMTPLQLEPCTSISPRHIDFVAGYIFALCKTYQLEKGGDYLDFYMNMEKQTALQSILFTILIEYFQCVIAAYHNQRHNVDQIIYLDDIGSENVLDYTLQLSCLLLIIDRIEKEIPFITTESNYLLALYECAMPTALNVKSELRIDFYRRMESAMRAYYTTSMTPHSVKRAFACLERWRFLLQKEGLGGWSEENNGSTEYPSSVDPYFSRSLYDHLKRLSDS